MARKKTITPKRRTDFLAHLRETGRVASSAESVGMSRQAFYDLAERDPEFKVLWDDAEAGFLDDVEAEAYRRAMDPEEKSDRLLESILKNRHPLYKPTKVLEVGGPGGQPLHPENPPNLDNLTDEELQSLVRLQRKIHDRPGG